MARSSDVVRMVQVKGGRFKVASLAISWTEMASFMGPKSSQKRKLDVQKDLGTAVALGATLIIGDEPR